MELNTLKQNYMIRTRPATSTGSNKMFNVHYIKAISSIDALEQFEKTEFDGEIIDVLQPGADVYGLTKHDIRAFFRLKELKQSDK
tara:strand:- start:259 stop:513 length:255 start_codon:yes stop_codon:yes gene_type:complete